MLTYFLGVATIPALMFVIFAFGVLRRSARDTYRYLRGSKRRPGISRLAWFRIVPLCFWDQFKSQLWAWANGVEREVSRD